MVALAWATFRLLGHGQHRHLLLRIAITVILLVGAASVFVFTLLGDRPGIALAIAVPAWLGGLTLATWLTRLMRGTVHEPDSQFSDLFVTWAGLLVALLFVIFRFA